MNTEPLVSIIIPVYNGANYVKEAIESAIAQTYKNTEIIVVNDGSNDNGATDEIVLSYGNRVRYFKKENGGVSSALNIGIREMKGEYFSWLSHDDVYSEDKIEKQIKALNNLRCDSLVYCNSAYIDKDSKEIKLRGKRLKPKTISGEESVKMILKRGSFGGCNFLIPREAFAKCGFFDEKLRFCQDLIMWYKIFLSGYSLRFIEDVGVKNRVHSGQLTQRGQALFKQECDENVIAWAEMFEEKSNKTNKYLFYFLKYFAKYVNKNNLKLLKTMAKQKKEISLIEVLIVNFVYLYGKIRPFIRKIYCKIFKKVNVK